MMTRAAHLTWCKKRAWEAYNYVKDKEGKDAAEQEAIASMVSDLGKHDETRHLSRTAVMIGILLRRCGCTIEKFINGFN